jgi:aminoglycoside phosphotransferase
MGDQAALTWKHDWCGDLELVWKKEPDTKVIEQIARHELRVPSEIPCTVVFLAEGAFNKVYSVQCGADTNHVVRIAAPVQPRLKVLSEIATIHYVRQHIDIPVPRVLAYDSSCNNKLDFEWIIMERVSGFKLSEQRQTMSWLKKEKVVRKVISCLVQLFQIRFPHLGNLYATKDLQRLPTADIPDTTLLGHEYTRSKIGFCLGQIVSIPFFWGNRLRFKVCRGPFQNSQDWLRTQLQLYLLTIDNPVIDEDPNGEQCTEELDASCTREAKKDRAHRLIDLLPTVFPSDESEAYVLHHGDLHEDNIFVDDNHEVSGIIDWECVHTVPLWAACEIPKFLDLAVERSECPDPDEYMKETLSDGTEELNSLYYEHLEQYENVELQKFFLEEMQRVCPEWIDIYRKNQLKAAFGEVVALVDDHMSGTFIDQWLDLMEENGTAPRLRELPQDY